MIDCGDGAQTFNHTGIDIQDGGGNIIKSGKMNTILKEVEEPNVDVVRNGFVLELVKEGGVASHTKGLREIDFNETTRMLYGIYCKELQEYYMVINSNDLFIFNLITHNSN